MLGLSCCTSVRREAGTNVHSIGPKWRAEDSLQAAMWWSVPLGTGMTPTVKLHDLETGETRTILHFYYFSWPDFDRIHWCFSSSCWTYIYIYRSGEV